MQPARTSSILSYYGPTSRHQTTTPFHLSTNGQTDVIERSSCHCALTAQIPRQGLGPSLSIFSLQPFDIDSHHAFPKQDLVASQCLSATHHRSLTPSCLALTSHRSTAKQSGPSTHSPLSTATLHHPVANQICRPTHTVLCPNELAPSDCEPASPHLESAPSNRPGSVRHRGSPICTL